MKRLSVAPINLADIPAEVLPNGSSRKLLYRDEATKTTTFVLTLPAGWRSQYAAGNLVHHLKREEFFNLSGVFKFGDWYDFPSPGYVNHPAYWPHPSDEHTVTGVTLFSKYTVPNDLVFSEYPPTWDGSYFRAADAPGDSDAGQAVCLDVNAVPWQPVHRADGSPAGFDAKTLYDDDGDGWTTWLMRLPDGWHSDGPAAAYLGGDELFVIEGDFTTARQGGVRLNANSYYCDPNAVIDGGSADSSEAGCIALRFTRGADHLRLPPRCW